MSAVVRRTPEKERGLLGLEHGGSPSASGADSPEPGQGSPRRQMQHVRAAMSVFLKATVAAALLWFLVASRRPSSSSSSGSSNASGGSSNALDACPLRYDRMAALEVREGAKPYLFGGDQRPVCHNCRNDSLRAKACQYKAGRHLCPHGAALHLVANWFARGFHLPLTMTPCDFWPFLRNRTLYMMGDTMMYDFYHAMTCFMYEFWDLEQADPVHERWLMRSLTTAPDMPPECAVLLGGASRICFIRVDRGQDVVRTLLPLFPHFAAPTDLLVLNFGVHHWKDYEGALHDFVRYHNEHREQLPYVLWQQTAMQHYNNSPIFNGDFPGGAPPFSCMPSYNFSVDGQGVIRLRPNKTDRYHGLLGGWRNAKADKVMRDSRIPIIPSHNETNWLYNMHRDSGRGWECTHYCHPSAPQSSVVALLRILHWVVQSLPPVPGESSAAPAAAARARRLRIGQESVVHPELLDWDVRSKDFDKIDTF